MACRRRTKPVHNLSPDGSKTLQNQHFWEVATHFFPGHPCSKILNDHLIGSSRSSSLERARYPSRPDHRLVAIHRPLQGIPALVTTVTFQTPS